MIPVTYRPKLPRHSRKSLSWVKAKNILDALIIQDFHTCHPEQSVPHPRDCPCRITSAPIPGKLSAWPWTTPMCTLMQAYNALPIDSAASPPHKAICKWLCLQQWNICGCPNRDNFLLTQLPIFHTWFAYFSASCDVRSCRHSFTCARRKPNFQFPNKLVLGVNTSTGSRLGAGA